MGGWAWVLTGLLIWGLVVSWGVALGKIIGRYRSPEDEE